MEDTPRMACGSVQPYITGAHIPSLRHNRNQCRSVCTESCRQISLTNSLSIKLISAHILLWSHSLREQSSQNAETVFEESFFIFVSRHRGSTWGFHRTLWLISTHQTNSVYLPGSGSPIQLFVQVQHQTQILVEDFLPLTHNFHFSLPFTTSHDRLNSAQLWFTSKWLNQQEQRGLKYTVTLTVLVHLFSRATCGEQMKHTQKISQFFRWMSLYASFSSFQWCKGLHSSL